MEGSGLQEGSGKKTLSYCLWKTQTGSVLHLKSDENQMSLPCYQSVNNDLMNAHFLQSVFCFFHTYTCEVHYGMPEIFPHCLILSGLKVLHSGIHTLSRLKVNI